MPRKRTLKIAAGIAASFIGLAGTIVYLSAAKMVSPGMGILMLVGLVGLYVGFGILIAVYRLISKLD